MSEKLQINETLLKDIFAENADTWTIDTKAETGTKIEPERPVMTEQQFVKTVSAILKNQIKNDTYTQQDPAITHQIAMKFGEGNQTKRL
ncbi:MAG: hypothetical protein ACOC2E_00065 [Bacteroidota bacterium]